MQTHDKLKKLFSNGIRVYPTVKGNKFVVTIDDDYNAIYKNKVNLGTTKHTTKTINKAIEDTINYLIERL
mgnify:CR=1 FL=1